MAPLCVRRPDTAGNLAPQLRAYSDLESFGHVTVGAHCRGQAVERGTVQEMTGGRAVVAHFYLARHGQTEWNVEQRMQGRTDSSLTRLGVEQAQRLRAALAEVALDAVFASPSPRALRTAELVCGDRKVPVVTVPALQEISLGAWEGRLIEDVVSEFPEAYLAYRRDPAAYRSPVGGESFDDVRKRVLTFWCQAALAAHGPNVLIVSHTVPLKILLAGFGGRPLKDLWEPPTVDPGSLFQVLERHGEVSVVQQSLRVSSAGV